jgi:hypothetical protein
VRARSSRSRATRRTRSVPCGPPPARSTPPRTRDRDESLPGSSESRSESAGGQHSPRTAPDGTRATLRDDWSCQVPVPTGDRRREMPRAWGRASSPAQPGPSASRPAPARAAWQQSARRPRRDPREAVSIRASDPARKNRRRRIRASRAEGGERATPPWLPTGERSVRCGSGRRRSPSTTPADRIAQRCQVTAYSRGAIIPARAVERTSTVIGALAGDVR